MTRTISGTLLRVSTAAAVAATLGACEVNLGTEGLTAREKRTFQVSGQPDVTLETFDGSIEIHSWDRDEVEVEVEKRGMEQSVLDQITIEAEQQGDTIVLRVLGPTRAESRGMTIGIHIATAARLYVAVPRRLLLQARTGDGSIRAEDLAGRVVLDTGDGSITVDRVSGDIEARTGDGSIRLGNVDGRLNLETNDGRIEVDGKVDLLRAHTGDGSVRVRVASGAAMAGDWDIETGDGSVTLVLPSAFDADLDAETRDGSVQPAHPLIAESASDRDGDRPERRRALRARMGAGGHVLRIRSGDGSIRIEP